MCVCALFVTLSTHFVACDVWKVSLPDSLLSTIFCDCMKSNTVCGLWQLVCSRPCRFSHVWIRIVYSLWVLKYCARWKAASVLLFRLCPFCSKIMIMVYVILMDVFTILLCFIPLLILIIPLRLLLVLLLSPPPTPPPTMMNTLKFQVAANPVKVN